MKFGFNPVGFGLLSGIGHAAAGYDMFNQRMMLMGARTEAYRARYEAMQNVQLMRAKFNGLLKAMDEEAKSRTYTVKGTAPDGTPTLYTYRNILDPQGSGHFVPHLEGSVPIKDSGAHTAAPVRPVTIGNRVMGYNEDTGKWDKDLGAAPSRGDPNADARELLRQGALNARAVYGASKAAKKEFDAAPQWQRNEILKKAGIDPTDPHAREKLFGIYDDQAEADFKKLQQHIDTLGGAPGGRQGPAQGPVGPGPGSNGAGGYRAPDGTFYPENSQIRDKNGNVIQIQNGKPVPMQPLAMDAAAAAQDNAQGGDGDEEEGGSEDTDNEEDEDQQQAAPRRGSGLLAQYDVGEGMPELEDEQLPPDEEDEQDVGGQGLINGSRGRYG